MQAGKAPRSRTVIRQPSRPSWTPRTLHPQKRNLVLQAGLLHAAAQSWPVLSRCLSDEITHANMFMKALAQMGKLDDPFSETFRRMRQ
jgi:hypothetical protein